MSDIENQLTPSNNSAYDKFKKLEKETKQKKIDRIQELKRDDEESITEMILKVKEGLTTRCANHSSRFPFHYNIHLGSALRKYTLEDLPALKQMLDEMEYIPENDPNEWKYSMLKEYLGKYGAFSLYHSCSCHGCCSEYFTYMSINDNSLGEHTIYSNIHLSFGHIDQEEPTHCQMYCANYIFGSLILSVIVYILGMLIWMTMTDN